MRLKESMRNMQDTGTILIRAETLNTLNEEKGKRRDTKINEKKERSSFFK